jgi:hypothetical protein
MKQLNFAVLVHTPVTAEPFDAPAGVTISNEDRVTYFDAEGLSLLTITISFATGVTGQILASWLYDRFVRPKSSKPAKEIKLNERVITVRSRDEFIQLIEHEIMGTERE